MLEITFLFDGDPPSLTYMNSLYNLAMRAQNDFVSRVENRALAPEQLLEAIACSCVETITSTTNRRNSKVPTVLIKANEQWWENWQAVIDQTIDTLTGMEARLHNFHLDGRDDENELRGEIEAQLNTIRRKLQTVRMPF